MDQETFTQILDEVTKALKAHENLYIAIDDFLSGVNPGTLERLIKAMNTSRALIENG